MPNRIQASCASASVVEIFKVARESLRGGVDTRCPSPLPQARSKGKNDQSWSGSPCLKLYHSTHPGAFVNHAVLLHGVPRSELTSGQYICEKTHPVSKKLCGHRFKREDHLTRHQDGSDGDGGRDCAAYEAKAIRTRGCDFVFASGIVCGLTFKKESQFVRHGQSKSHGGPGARAASATKGDVEKSNGKNTNIDSNLEASPASTKEEVRTREDKTKRIGSPEAEVRKVEDMTKRIESLETVAKQREVRKRNKSAVGRWERLRGAHRKGRKRFLLRTVSFLQKKLEPSKKVSRNTFKEVVEHLEEDVDDPESCEQDDLGSGDFDEQDDSYEPSTIVKLFQNTEGYHSLGPDFVDVTLDRYRSVIKFNSQ